MSIISFYSFAAIALGGITEAHMEMQAWITDQGRAWRGESIEEYITDPGEVPDPKDWHTKISYPLA